MKPKTQIKIAISAVCFSVLFVIIFRLSRMILFKESNVNLGSFIIISLFVHGCYVFALLKRDIVLSWMAYFMWCLSAVGPLIFAHLLWTFGQHRELILSGLHYIGMATVMWVGINGVKRYKKLESDSLSKNGENHGKYHDLV